MCCSKRRTALTTTATCGQVAQSRCSSCYKAAPYHRRNNTLAAATIQAAAENPALNQLNVPLESQTRPSYGTAMATSKPTVVAPESRYVPHGPIGFALRWGVEKVQKKRDEKKFMEEFEQRRSVDRRSWTGSESSDRSSQELVDSVWKNDEKYPDKQ